MTTSGVSLGECTVGRGGIRLPDPLMLWRVMDSEYDPFNFLHYFRQLWRVNGATTMLVPDLPAGGDQPAGAMRELWLPPSGNKPWTSIREEFRVMGRTPITNKIESVYGIETHRVLIPSLGSLQLNEVLSVHAPRTVTNNAAQPLPDPDAMIVLGPDSEAEVRMHGHPVGIVTTSFPPEHVQLDPYTQDLKDRGFDMITEAPFVLSTMVKFFE